MAKLPDGGEKIRFTVEKMTKALEYMKLTNDEKIDEQNVKKETSPSGWKYLLRLFWMAY